MGRYGKDIPQDPAGRQDDDDNLLWEKVTQSVKRMNPQPAFQTPKQRKAQDRATKKDLDSSASSLFKLVK